MRLSTVAIIGTTFAAAAALCYVAAGFVVSGENELQAVCLHFGPRQLAIVESVSD